MKIRADIDEKEGELTRQIDELERSCKKTRELLNAEIEDYEKRLSDAQTDLASGTRKQNEAEATSALKNREFETHTDEYWKKTKTCHANYAKYEAEECGLKKIRGELYKMQASNHPAFFQDCEVTEWEDAPEGCSRDCGGGFQIIRRRVVNVADGGAKCPPLEAKVLCNQHPCPKDCKYQDWGGWSKCSAECDGGTRQRARSILQRAAYGGEPCSGTKESVECNVQACDKNCVLGEWSAWSDCSKQCSGGHMAMTREIQESSIGAGTCQSKFSQDRLKTQRCNVMKCKKSGSVLKCASNVDVILLLDGSLTLGELGWHAMTQQAKRLVEAIGGGNAAANRVKLLLYSGPIGEGAMRKIDMCNGRVSPDWSGSSFEEVCKMQWLTDDWTNDTEAAIAAINSATWPQGSTQTSVALGLAETALGSAREEAMKRVILMTASRPTYIRATTKAAARLKQKAKLHIIRASDNAPGKTHCGRWSSRPNGEHVVSVPDFNGLYSADVTDKVIPNVCRSVY